MQRAHVAKHSMKKIFVFIAKFFVFRLPAVFVTEGRKEKKIRVTGIVTSRRGLIFYNVVEEDSKSEG